MKNLIFPSLQFLFFLAAAPFLSGLISKIKNNLRMRKGQGVFQPYYNISKLFCKQEVVSETASWIFRAAPIIVFSSTLCAAMIIPGIIFFHQLNFSFELLSLVFVLALGRFFLALAALDTGSSFGGMGSSREMFISSLAEPALILVLFCLSLKTGSTSLLDFSGYQQIPASFIIAGISLFLIILAETSRIPVDNQETHLELTMVHEAMILEYSGRSLAFLELAASIKQVVFFFLIAELVFPARLFSSPEPLRLAAWVFWYFGRFFIIAAVVAIVEVSIAKMRLFRVADFLGFAFVLSVIASICAIMGV